MNIIQILSIVIVMISYLKALLIFYLLIISSQASGLIGTQLGDLVRENRYAQHVIGYCLMLVIVGEFGQTTNPYRLLFMTTMYYILFIITTKTELQWNVSIIILLILAYLYEVFMNDTRNRISQDESLGPEEAANLEETAAKNKSIMFVTIGIVAVIGTVIYLRKKQVQYGGNFELEKFFLENRN
jgi:hypothetical protein